MKKIISIVIPAYREEKNIPQVVADITAIMQPLPYEYEIVLVNDGSPDATWSVISALCANDTHVCGIDLSRNFGKEIALTAGLQYTRGDAVITLDADGQHPPEKIPDFIAEWESGIQIVYNRRPETKNISWLKKMSSKAFYWVFNHMSEFKLEPNTTDYRLLDRTVVDAYLRFGEKNRMYRGLIDWLGFRKKALIFGAKKRLHGDATYSYNKLFRLAINNLTSFSFFPLKFVGYLGLAISLGSLAMLFLQSLDKLGFIHMGFSNIGIVIVLNTIMIGIVLMSLGLIGLYIANIHEEVINRPLYLVKEKKNILV